VPVLRESLDREGALVSILVGLSDSSIRRLRSQFQPIPQPVECRALLDTGAEITCVDSRLVESLNLVDGGFSFANVPSVRESTMLASLYDLSLYSPRGEMTQLALAANDDKWARYERIRGCRRRSSAKAPGVVLPRCTDASIHLH